MRESLFTDLPDGMADAALDRAAMAAHEADAGAEQDAVVDERVVEAVTRILRILLGERGPSPTTERLAGRRLWMLSWLLRPESLPGFDGQPVSMRQMGQCLGVSHASLVQALTELKRSVDLENCFTRSHGRQRQPR